MTRYRSRRRVRYASLPGLGVVLLFLGGLFLSSTGVSYETTFTKLVLWLGIVMFAILGLLGLVAYFQFRRAAHRRHVLQINDIDQMSGIEFEKYVADLLKDQGYRNIRLTPQAGDFGTDVLAERDGLRYAVQVKRYRGNVNVDALYQSLGGRDYYGCDRAMVVTNSVFTQAAKELASKANIQLVSRVELLEWMMGFQKN